MTPIYLDNNATTPMLPQVLEAMLPHLTGLSGNPASAHQVGRRARRALEDARERVAHLLDAFPEEVVFTSGATEANNHAIHSLARPQSRVLAGAVEHPSVTEPVRRLAELGCEVHWLPVDRTGVLALEHLPGEPREGTSLVAVQLANHETGAVHPVARVVRAFAATSAVHCDATQAVGKVPVRFHELGVSTLALSAHKFHGPRGVGALLVRSDIQLSPLLRGGHQQRGVRPGTEPVALAVGLAAALELAHEEMAARRQKVLALRRRLLDALRAEVPPVVLNGPEEGGLPHTLNLSFPGVKADVLLMNLDLEGVACSTGSACSSGSLLPSPVLRAMGVPDDVLRSAMRFSLSFLLSEAEVDDAARRIAAVVRRLR